MRLLGPSAARPEFVAVLLFFVAVAYLITPFRLGDLRVLVGPNVEVDAAQQALLIRDGIDKLATEPGNYYDTAILYPDRTQLRSTEPLLGYVLIGMPIRSALDLSDADLFEVLRWVLVFLSLVYAYLLYKALGLSPAMAAAGAVLCWSLDIFLYGVERLQVVSMPFVFAVFYHGLMAARSNRLLSVHSAGLFASSALYPLFGAVNATIAVVAGLLVLPWLARLAIVLHRQGRLTSCVLPIGLAALVDAAVLAPWLFDRADLAVFAGDAFLQVKHWNPIRFPPASSDVARYIDGLLGPALLGTLCMALAAGVVSRIRGRGTAGQPAASPAPEKYFWPLMASLGLLSAAVLLRAGQPVVSVMRLVFDLACWGTLLLFWAAQVRWFPSGASAVNRAAASLAMGLGVFLCLMSFGPVYVSNPHPLATQILRALVEVMPPLAMIREYSRFWPFGFLFLSIYATLRLDLALRPHRPAVRLAASVAIVAGSLWPVTTRPLAASQPIEAPRSLVQLLSYSERTGGVYVHPGLDWNSPRGVSMIAVARETRRPIVNGYLGIMPPWFGHAQTVLRKFPDPEALWLLRKWKVESVVGPPGTVTEGQARHIVDFEGLALWEIDPVADMQHPSASGSLPLAAGLVRVEQVWQRAEETADGAVIVKVPSGMRPRMLEIHFAQSVTEPVPEAVNVYGFEGKRGVRLNEGPAGEWIESLAADDLLRRQWPKAAIRLVRSDSRELLVEFRSVQRPAIERMFVIGERSE